MDEILGSGQDPQGTQESMEAQLYAELIRMEKNTAHWQKVTGIALIGLFLIFGIALMILVPKASAAFGRMTDTMETVDKLAVQAEEALAQVDEIASQAAESIDNIDIMVQDVDDFVADNTDSVNQAVNHFNEIDFDSLNQAIQDLRDVVEPLANFTRRFQ